MCLFWLIVLAGWVVATVWNVSVFIQALAEGQYVWAAVLFDIFYLVQGFFSVIFDSLASAS
jgi:hypothetical protein